MSNDPQSRKIFKFFYRFFIQKNWISISILSIIFSWVFVFFIGNQFSRGHFADLNNYVYTIENIDLNIFLGKSEGNFSSFILNEPGWAILLATIQVFLNDPLFGLKFISFFSIFIYFSFVTRFTSSFIIPTLFLLNPIVVDLALSQIRSGLALSFFLLAVFFKSNVIRIVLFILAGTFHSAIAILVFGYLVTKTVAQSNSITSIRSRITIVVIASLFISVILSVGREILLGFFGDRRAVYNVEASSVTYVIFWFAIAMVLNLYNYAYNRNLQWISLFVLFLTGIGFFTNIFSTNGTRFIALALPLMLVSIHYQHRTLRYLVYLFLFLYQIVQYMYWL